MYSKLKNFISIVLIASLSGYGGSYLYHQKTESAAPVSIKNSIEQPKAVGVKFVSNPAGDAPNSTRADGGPDFVKAAESSVQAVVHVKVVSTVQYQFNNPFGGFFGQPQTQRQEGSGSGVIITEDGYIVTNNHVVDHADKVEVTLNDKRTFTAKVVGTDPSTDLALLKIDEKGLPIIVYGNSDELKVGEWVLAVGNPFNLTSTVTAGIVSAKARNIGIIGSQNPNHVTNSIESYIQTDAVVNPGNSGGALVNTKGELVGINSAIESQTGTYMGYSFAIPVNIVRKVMDDLVQYGNVQRGFIGISIADIDSKLAQEKGLKEYRGVYVAGLTYDGAAKRAGIQSGDVITKVGDVDVNSISELQEQVSRYHPGDKISVSGLRDGKPELFSVVLRNMAGNTSIEKSVPTAASLNMLGANFSDASRDDKNNLGISGGAKITLLNPGKMRNSGIHEGFIITSVDKKPIRSLNDLENALKDKQGGVLIEGVYPNGMKGYYGFGL
jgi:serine protease Do